MHLVIDTICELQATSTALLLNESTFPRSIINQKRRPRAIDLMHSEYDGPTGMTAPGGDPDMAKAWGSLWKNSEDIAARLGKQGYRIKFFVFQNLRHALVEW
jgi:hypothetical protein